MAASPLIGYSSNSLKAQKKQTKGHEFMKKLRIRKPSKASLVPPLSPSLSFPSGLAGGFIFGRDLESICIGENLPPPILNLLAFLYREGPTSKGVFRVSPSKQKMIQIKTDLDNGLNCQFEDVQLAASLLKEFVRNIPDSLLVSRFHSEWIQVLEISDDEEKISHIKSLVDRLPSHNLLMLRHLFGLLHVIYRESDINQMTSHNLAVCWGPNLLTSLSSSSNNSGGAAAEDELDAGAAVEQLNLLVDFLIVQAPRVFGEDCLDLLSDLARSFSMDEDTNELFGRTQVQSQESHDSLSSLDHPTLGSAQMIDAVQSSDVGGCTRERGASLEDCESKRESIPKLPVPPPRRKKSVCPVSLAKQVSNEELGKCLKLDDTGRLYGSLDSVASSNSISDHKSEIGNTEESEDVTDSMATVLPVEIRINDLAAVCDDSKPNLKLCAVDASLSNAIADSEQYQPASKHANVDITRSPGLSINSKSPRAVSTDFIPPPRRKKSNAFGRDKNLLDSSFTRPEDDRTSIHDIPEETNDQHDVINRLVVNKEESMDDNERTSMINENEGGEVIDPKNGLPSNPGCDSMEKGDVVLGSNKDLKFRFSRDSIINSNTEAESVSRLSAMNKFHHRYSTDSAIGSMTDSADESGFSRKLSVSQTSYCGGSDVDYTGSPSDTRSPVVDGGDIKSLRNNRKYSTLGVLTESNNMNCDAGNATDPATNVQACAGQLRRNTYCMTENGKDLFPRHKNRVPSFYSDIDTESENFPSILSDPDYCSTWLTASGSVLPVDNNAARNAIKSESDIVVDSTGLTDSSGKQKLSHHRSSSLFENDSRNPKMVNNMMQSTVSAPRKPRPEHPPPYEVAVIQTKQMKMLLGQLTQDTIDIHNKENIKINTYSLDGNTVEPFVTNNNSLNRVAEFSNPNKSILCSVSNKCENLNNCADVNVKTIREILSQESQPSVGEQSKSQLSSTDGVQCNSQPQLTHEPLEFGSSANFCRYRLTCSESSGDEDEQVRKRSSERRKKRRARRPRQRYSDTALMKCQKDDVKVSRSKSDSTTWLEGRMAADFQNPAGTRSGKVVIPNADIFKRNEYNSHSKESNSLNGVTIITTSTTTTTTTTTTSSTTSTTTNNFEECSPISNEQWLKSCMEVTGLIGTGKHGSNLGTGKQSELGVDLTGSNANQISKLNVDHNTDLNDNLPSKLNTKSKEDRHGDLPAVRSFEPMNDRKISESKSVSMQAIDCGCCEDFVSSRRRLGSRTIVKDREWHKELSNQFSNPVQIRNPVASKKVISDTDDQASSSSADRRNSDDEPKLISYIKRLDFEETFVPNSSGLRPSKTSDPVVKNSGVLPQVKTESSCESNRKNSAEIVGASLDSKADGSEKVITTTENSEKERSVSVPQKMEDDWARQAAERAVIRRHSFANSKVMKEKNCEGLFMADDGVNNLKRSVVDTSLIVESEAPPLPETPCPDDARNITEQAEREITTITPKSCALDVDVTSSKHENLPATQTKSSTAHAKLVPRQNVHHAKLETDLEINDPKADTLLPIADTQVSNAVGGTVDELPLPVAILKQAFQRETGTYTSQLAKKTVSRNASLRGLMPRAKEPLEGKFSVQLGLSRKRDSAETGNAISEEVEESKSVSICELVRDSRLPATIENPADITNEPTCSSLPEPPQMPSHSEPTDLKSVENVDFSSILRKKDLNRTTKLDRGLKTQSVDSIRTDNMVRSRAEQNPTSNSSNLNLGRTVAPARPSSQVPWSVTNLRRAFLDSDI